MKNKLEKFGSFGALVAAAACPICFPKLALFGALFGLGVLSPFETIFFFTAQVLFVLAIIGHIKSYKTHGNRTVLTIAVASGLLFFSSLYVYVSEIMTYIAFTGIVGATFYIIFANRNKSTCQSVSK